MVPVEQESAGYLPTFMWMNTGMMYRGIGLRCDEIGLVLNSVRLVKSMLQGDVTTDRTIFVALQMIEVKLQSSDASCQQSSGGVH